MIQLLILADDFTGALDTGVQFALAGIATRVITGQEVSLEGYSQTCQVLVVDAQTRHLTARAAGQAVAGYVRQAMALGIPHIYKKTDSALRGNIGAELAAVLQAAGEAVLPFLPAFPQMNRITRQGIHYIQDVPVAQSVFGTDPFEPVRCSQVPELIRLQTSIPALSCPVPKSEADLPTQPGIWVFDAQTLQDLQQTGACLAVAGKTRILAGCAGFAAVLPGLLHLDTGTPTPVPVLGENFTVICGSVNPITQAQVAHAEEQGFFHQRLLPEQKLTSGYWKTPQGEQMLQQLLQMLQDHPHRIIDTNDDAGNEVTACYASQLGMGIQDIRKAVSGTIGYLVSRLFAHEAVGTLLITGGDTLLECMTYMGVHEIEPIGELEAGVVLSRFAYQGVSRYVISKSGGFGGPTLLTDLAKAIC